MPEGEWFCAECQTNSIYQVEAIVDKRDKMKRLRNGQRTGKACVHYRVQFGRGAAVGGARHLGAAGKSAGTAREGDG